MSTEIQELATRGTAQNGFRSSGGNSRATLAIRTNNQTSHSTTESEAFTANSVGSGRDVVERLRAKDPVALEELFDRMSGRAFGLAYRILSDGPAAEDVVQDVFCWIWDHSNKLDPARGSVDGLLLTLTHRRAIDSLRTRIRRTEILATMQPPDWVLEAGELVDQVQRDLDAEAIQKAIDRLPEEQGEVVDLAYFVGMSHSEISTTTGLPLGTVKSRLRLAVSSLRKSFGLSGDTSRSGGAS